MFSVPREGRIAVEVMDLGRAEGGPRPTGLARPGCMRRLKPEAAVKRSEPAKILVCEISRVIVTA
jgi:hypothetical protein